MPLRLLAFLLLLAAAASPAGAQDVPDCTVDVEVSPALVLDVRQRCGIGEPQRYRVDLPDLPPSRELILRGHSVLATLGSWLRAPEGYAAPPTIDIRVKTPTGMAFAAGLPRVGDASRLAGTGMRFAGYTAIGRFDLSELPTDRGVLHLAILDGMPERARAALVDWVRRTAEAQVNWWRGFTAPSMLIGLVPSATRRAVGYGRTVPGGGATIMVEVGREVDPRRLFDDWVLTHELVHTGMPFIRGRATWFMEGAATYIEPIVRARAGWKTEEEVWREWMEHMPRGVSAFASGLQHASGQQNYWGGAIFMLMADLALRRETGGRLGLEDCLVGALRAGLTADRRTGLEDYAEACEGATGTVGLRHLLDRHVARGTPVDLDALWRELGVALHGERVAFDETAPLAALRRQIVFGTRPNLRIRLPWET
ncbi:MAG: hypothetical protein KIT25_04340 [Enhydrobacter sp.]|nr:MAG: hypothetical protein KIT25_04340 [Enhydrobacter sp.]